VHAEHVALGDTDLVKGLCGVLEEGIIEDELLGFGGNGGFALHDGFEELNGHVAADFEVDYVRVRIGADDADGDTPGSLESWGAAAAGDGDSHGEVRGVGMWEE
jgi:hypothetical protein